MFNCYLDQRKPYVLWYFILFQILIRRNNEKNQFLEFNKCVRVITKRRALKGHMLFQRLLNFIWFLWKDQTILLYIVIIIQFPELLLLLHYLICCTSC